MYIKRLYTNVMREKYKMADSLCDLFYTHFFWLCSCRKWKFREIYAFKSKFMGFNIWARFEWVFGDIFSVFSPFNKREKEKNQCWNVWNFKKVQKKFKSRHRRILSALEFQLCKHTQPKWNKKKKTNVMTFHESKFYVSLLLYFQNTLNIHN